MVYLFAEVHCAMNKSHHSWEGAILMFAAAVTTATMLAYRFMITYNWTIPWYVWPIIVVVCAALTFGPRLIRRQPKP